MNKALTFAYNACLFAVIALVLSWLMSSQAIVSSIFIVRLTEVWYLMALLFLISSFFGIMIHSKTITHRITALAIFIFGIWHFIYTFTLTTPFIVPNHISYYFYHLGLISYLIIVLKDKDRNLKTHTLFAVLLVISQTLLSVLNFRLELLLLPMTSVDYFFYILYYVALLRFFNTYRNNFDLKPKL